MRIRQATEGGGREGGEECDRRDVRIGQREFGWANSGGDAGDWGREMEREEFGGRENSAG